MYEADQRQAGANEAEIAGLIYDYLCRYLNDDLMDGDDMRDVAASPAARGRGVSERTLSDFLAAKIAAMMDGPARPGG